MYMYNSLPKMLQQISNSEFNSEKQYMIDQDIFIETVVKRKDNKYSCLNKNHMKKGGKRSFIYGF